MRAARERPFGRALQESGERSRRAGDLAQLGDHMKMPGPDESPEAGRSFAWLARILAGARILHNFISNCDCAPTSTFSMSMRDAGPVVQSSEPPFPLTSAM